MQEMAKWISWLVCPWILIWNWYKIFRFGFPTSGSIVVTVIIFAIVAFYVWLMLTRKYVFAFGLAIGQLVIITMVLFFALYPPIPGGYLEPLVDFKFAIWIWLFGGSILTTAMWVCYKAIKEITHSTNKPSH